MKKPKAALWFAFFILAAMVLITWELKRTEATNKHFEGAIWQR